MALKPKLIYGTACFIVNAVLQGFRAVDTACQPKHYREDLVGAALDELKEKYDIKREDLFIQTKFTPIGGQDTSKPIPYNPYEPVKEQITTSFQASLKNLRTAYLDSYLLHSPLQTLEQTLEAWKTLGALQDEGKVHLIGVSNTYDVRTLAALQRVRAVQVVQNRWYEGNQWDKAVVNFCREHNIMYQSFWTLSGSPSLLSNHGLLAIAHVANLTPAQTLFKLAQLEGITPLSGTTSEEHMRQDIAVESAELPDTGVERSLKEVHSLIRG